METEPRCPVDSEGSNNPAVIQEFSSLFLSARSHCLQLVAVKLTEVFTVIVSGVRF